MTPALRQLCVQLSCAIHSHSSVADHFQDVSLITRNSKLMGVKLDMTAPHFEHPEIDYKSCHALAHNCAKVSAAESFEKVSFAQVLRNFRIVYFWILLSCRNM